MTNHKNKRQEEDWDVEDELADRNLSSGVKTHLILEMGGGDLMKVGGLMFPLL